MTTQELKQLGFEIQAEQKRAVYHLSGQDEFRIIVESDKSIHLNMGGFNTEVNNLEPTLESGKLITIEKLIEMFKNSKLKYPF